jgi:hypothetical protein
MSEKILTVTIPVTIEIPEPPTVLGLSNGGAVETHELTDQQLEQVGRAWTEALKARARGKAGDRR